jgi:hypothetical protein
MHDVDEQFPELSRLLCGRMPEDRGICEPLPPTVEKENKEGKEWKEGGMAFACLFAHRRIGPFSHEPSQKGYQNGDHIRINSIFNR